MPFHQNMRIDSMPKATKMVPQEPNMMQNYSFMQAPQPAFMPGYGVGYHGGYMMPPIQNQYPGAQNMINNP